MIAALKSLTWDLSILESFFETRDFRKVVMLCLCPHLGTYLEVSVIQRVVLT